VIPGSEVILRGVGLNPTRRGIIDVFRKMGSNISVFNERTLCGEPSADLLVRASALSGVHIEGRTVPSLIDEIPVIAVAATFADGVTVIKDAGELRVKETDRIHAIACELRKFGAKVEEKEDGLVIHGGNSLSGTVCDSHGDHRIAMSMAIAGSACGDETIIGGAGCIDISFPGFADVLKTLREE
ncbi:MAG TPA: 3-phosphoshikimate 1-carboxyvinyltransferase, partial [Clostridia bacterium]|nr:3-phosphoshikimate 1-carboxyvinyltransferase [Clostridia bacterium]